MTPEQKIECRLARRRATYNKANAKRRGYPADHIFGAKVQWLPEDGIVDEITVEILSRGYWKYGRTMPPECTRTEFARAVQLCFQWGLDCREIAERMGSYKDTVHRVICETLHAVN